MADVLARRLRPEDADSPADGLDDGKHWVWSFPPQARRSIRRIPGRRVSRRSWRKQPDLYRPQKRARLNKLFRREGREIRLPVQVFPEPLIHCRSPGRPSVCAPCQPSSRALRKRPRRHQAQREAPGSRNPSGSRSSRPNASHHRHASTVPQRPCHRWRTRCTRGGPGTSGCTPDTASPRESRSTHSTTRPRRPPILLSEQLAAFLALRCIRRSRSGDRTCRTPPRTLRASRLALLCLHRNLHWPPLADGRASLPAPPQA